MALVLRAELLPPQPSAAPLHVVRYDNGNHLRSSANLLRPNGNQSFVDLHILTHITSNHTAVRLS